MGLEVKKTEDETIVITQNNNEDYTSQIFEKNFSLSLQNITSSGELWFFGENINLVQCIVGKNGTGKTTILNTIRKYYEEENINTIFYDGSNLIFNGERQDPDLGINHTRELLNSIKLSSDNDNNSELHKISYFNNYNDNWESYLWENAYYNSTDSDIGEVFRFSVQEYCEDIKDNFLHEKDRLYKPNTVLTSEYGEHDSSAEKKRVLLSESYNFKTIMFGLSQGELSKVKLFVSLYEHMIKVKEEQVTILLDEPETHFHPEWCRNLIKELLFFFKENFPQNKVSLYLSTHSPLIIADLPVQSVKYMDFDEKNKIINKTDDSRATFGEELNTLFMDNFYLIDRRGALFSEKLYEVYQNYAQCILGQELDCTVEKINQKKQFIVENTDNKLIKQSLDRFDNIVKEKNGK